MGFQFGNMNGFWGGGMIFVWILMVILVIFLFRQSSGNSTPTSPDTALEILKKRYAKGQITHEEFEEMKAHLEDIS